MTAATAAERRPRVFGLTGGIASGKSSVAARFRARGLPVIDADRLAREAVAPGSAALRDIVEAFGGDVLLPDGTLDRQRVARDVFADPARRGRLNAIVHPRVFEGLARAVDELGGAGEPLACYEAALIVENGAADAFRPLVVVAAPVEVQIARAVLRDGASEADVRARVAAQVPLEDKIRAADHVLENVGTLEELDAAADAVLARVCVSLGVDPTRYGLPGRDNVPPG